MKTPGLLAALVTTLALGACAIVPVPSHGIAYGASIHAGIPVAPPARIEYYPVAPIVVRPAYESRPYDYGPRLRHHEHWR